MTQDEIIELARHADREWDCDRDMFEWLETFAQQVAEREREACAKTVAGLKDKSGVNEDGNAWLTRVTKSDCVQAIRARGQE
jgi:hypothetical protein